MPDTAGGEVDFLEMFGHVPAPDTFVQRYLAGPQCTDPSCEMAAVAHWHMVLDRSGRA